MNTWESNEMERRGFYVSDTRFWLGMVLPVSPAGKVPRRCLWRWTILFLSPKAGLTIKQTYGLFVGHVTEGVEP